GATSWAFGFSEVGWVASAGFSVTAAGFTSSLFVSLPAVCVSVDSVFFGGATFGAARRVPRRGFREVVRRVVVAGFSVAVVLAVSSADFSGGGFGAATVSSIGRGIVAPTEDNRFASDLDRKSTRLNSSHVAI